MGLGFERLGKVASSESKAKATDEFDAYMEGMERSADKQRRYELARDLAHGFAASGIRGGNTPTVKLIASMAVETADALLELLAKEPEKEPG